MELGHVEYPKRWPSHRFVLPSSFRSIDHSGKWRGGIAITFRFVLLLIFVPDIKVDQHCLEASCYWLARSGLVRMGLTKIPSFALCTSEYTSSK